MEMSRRSRPKRKPSYVEYLDRLIVPKLYDIPEDYLTGGKTWEQLFGKPWPVGTVAAAPLSCPEELAAAQQELSQAKAKPAPAAPPSSELLAAQQELVQLKVDLAATQQALASSAPKAELLAAQQEVVQLKVDLAAAQKELTTRTSTLLATEQQLRQTKDNFDERTLEIQSLATQVETSTQKIQFILADNATLLNGNQTLTVQVEKLEKENSTLKQTNSDLQVAGNQERATLRATAQKLQQDLAACTARNAQLQDKHKKELDALAAQELASFQKEKQRADDAERIVAQVQSKTRQSMKAATDLTKCQEQLAALQAELEQARFDLQNCSQQATVAQQGEILALESQVQECSSQQEQLSAQLTENLEAQDQLIAQTAQLQQETAAAKQQASQQQEALTDQQAQLAERDKRIVELRDKLIESQTKTAEQVQRAMTSFIDLQQCIAQRQADEQKLGALATVEEKTAGLTADLAAAVEEKNNLLSKLASLETELKKATVCCKETEGLTAEFEEQYAFGKQQDTRITDLTRRNQELSSEITSLKKTLEGSRKLFLQLQEERDDLETANDTLNQTHAAETEAIRKQLAACQAQTSTFRSLLKQK